MKQHFRLTAICLFVFLMTSILLPTACAQKCWVIGDYVNIRKGPGKNYEKFNRIARIGDMTDIEETDKGPCYKYDEIGRKWYSVSGKCGVDDWGGGWILARYVTFDKPDFIERTCYISANGRVAARRTADKNSDVLEWLHDGDEIKVNLVTGEWAWTDRGYVKRDFISGI